MFNFFKKNPNKEMKLVAPITGNTIDLSTVPDPVFSEKLNILIFLINQECSLPFRILFSIKKRHKHP
jgi:hypothetical protein